MSNNDNKRPPRVNKLAQRLLGQTANLERNITENPSAPIASQRNVTMPGQLGAFRLEAQKYQSKIDELQRQLAEAVTNQGESGVDGEAAELRTRLAQLEDERRTEVEALKAALDEAARGAGQPFEAPVDRIRKIAGRQRVLSEAEKEALFANLDNNKLVTPVTLRPASDGWYDMISGHNRLDYYVDRGRPHIPAVLDLSDDEHADRDAFYANLLQNTLTDYAKYLGFKKLQADNPAQSMTEIAKHAGQPRSTVANLMVFGDLPPAAMPLLDAHQDKLGRSAAAELAALHAKGHTDGVMTAIEAIVAGTVSQSEGVAMAIKSAKPIATPRIAPPAFTVRSGRATYCKVQQAKKVLRLEFATEGDADLALTDITKALQALADGSKQ